MNIGKKPSANKGSMMIVATIFMLAFSLILFPLIKRSQSNVKTSTKFIHENRADYLARSGIDKGLFKVLESPDFFKSALNGTTITDFDGLSVHSDRVNKVGQNTNIVSTSKTGTYTINITSGPNPRQIKVTSIGTPNKSSLAKKITHIYEDDSLKGPVYIESEPLVVDYSTPYVYVASGGVTGPQVHWGPIISYRGIDLSQSPILFPRKFSSWRVLGRDNGSEFYANSDLKEYWAHYKNDGVHPEFDIETMRQQAIDNATYFVGPLSIAPTRLNANTTWFFEGDLNIDTDIFLRGIVIVTGDLTINPNSSGWNIGTETDNLPIPEGALQEYAKYYETHSGYPVGSGFDIDPAATTYSFPFESVGMRAFLYVGGNMTVNTGANPFYIYGAAYVKGAADFGTINSFRVHYADFENGAVPRPAIARPSLKLISEKSENIPL